MWLRARGAIVNYHTTTIGEKESIVPISFVDQDNLVIYCQWLSLAQASVIHDVWYDSMIEPIIEQD